jgi:hypothetical protein
MSLGPLRPASGEGWDGGRFVDLSDMSDAAGGGGAPVSGYIHVVDAQAIAAGASRQDLVDVSDFRYAYVLAWMSATASGDLTCTARFVRPDDDTTVIPVDINPLASVDNYGPPSVFRQRRYDVSTLDRIAVRCTNNNAASQTLNIFVMGKS